MRRTLIWLPTVLTAGTVAACVGHVGDGGVGLDVGPGAAPLACAGNIYPGDAPVRRMTRFEYNNTVRDLLGDKTAPGSNFPADEVSGIFNNQASALVVTELLAEGYMNAAESLATTAVADVNALTGCDPKQVDPAVCGAKFIDAFGKKAFRRPLDADAKAMLTSVFTQTLPRGYATAIRLVIEAALQSPRFLYRLEFGMPDPKSGEVMQLDDYEVASRLSFLLWGSMPDAELFTAADNKALRTPAEIEKQARRMLEDPRARRMLESFHEQWLGLTALDTVDKDTKLFPKYTPALKATWKAETLAFTSDVIFDGDGSLTTLLSAPYTMMNAEVASFYGVASPAGAGFQRVELDPKQRAGLLTQPSVLAVNAHADQTSPVNRGKFVRERLLCQPLAPPPPNVDTTPPPVSPDATTRERFTEHEKNPVCASCHVQMDPIGFGFENFDSLGLWRDTEGSLPIDASGNVVNAKDANGTFVGAVELAERLAQSEQVRSCVVTQWFTYAQGRPQQSEDQCSVQKLKAAFADAKYDIKDLLVGLTQTDAFLYRKRVSPGK